MEGWVIIGLFLLSILLMFFFAGMEMAYYSANRINIEIRKKAGSLATDMVNKFINNPTSFIGTTLFGFTFFLSLFTLLMSFVMAPFWEYLKIGSDFFHIVIELFLSIVTVIIFCGFLPRVIFRTHSTGLLTKLWLPGYFFYEIFSPITDSFVRLSKWALKYIFNIRISDQKQTLTHSDLKSLFRHNRFQSKQLTTQLLLENAQKFPNIKIRQCLVPRKEIVALPFSSTIEEVSQKMIELKYSKVVIYGKNIDDIRGFVHILDLFKKPANLSSILLSLSTVPESMNATELLSIFSATKKNIAWVVDEYGGTAGIVTLEDLLEELFGTLKDEYLEDKHTEQMISENEYIFSGRMEIDFLTNKYGLVFTNAKSETLSGYIIDSTDKIPQKGDRIILDNYEIEIIDAAETHILLAKVRRLKYFN